MKKFLLVIMCLSVFVNASADELRTITIADKNCPEFSEPREVTFAERETMFFSCTGNFIKYKIYYKNRDKNSIPKVDIKYKNGKNIKIFSIDFRGYYLNLILDENENIEIKLL